MSTQLYLVTMSKMFLCKDRACPAFGMGTVCGNSTKMQCGLELRFSGKQAIPNRYKEQLL